MKLKEYAIKLKKEVMEDQVSAYAAQSAYFIILSVIPFFIVFTSMLRLTPVTEGDLLTLINDNTPTYLKSMLVFIINEVYTNSIESISITALVAIWSAAKGIQYLANGLNQIYDREETRNWFVLRFRAIIYTLIFAVMFEVLLVVIVFAKKLINLVALRAPAIGNILEILIRFRILVIPLILILFFAFVYKALPNVKLSYKEQLPGAAICAAAWYIFSYGLSVYVDYFNGFSMYGSLITVVLIMFWLYICLSIFLICGEINSSF